MTWMLMINLCVSGFNVQVKYVASGCTKTVKTWMKISMYVEYVKTSFNYYCTKQTEKCITSYNFFL